MEQNFDKLMTLRIPILSLNGDSNNLDVDNILNFLNLDSIEAKEKYIKRMRYRTNPLFGMVKEFCVSPYSLEKKFPNCNLLLSNIRFKFIGKWKVNPQVIRKSEYVFLRLDEKEYRLDSEFFSLFNTLTQEFTIDELRRLMLKEYFFSNEDLEIDYFIQQLCDYRFIIPKLQKVAETTLPNKIAIDNSKGLLLREKSSDDVTYLNLDERSLNKLGDLLSRLCNFRDLNLYQQAVEYFLESYSHTKIKILDIFNDIEFRELVLKLSIIEHSTVKDEIQRQILNYVEAKHIINGEKIVNINLKELGWQRNSSFKFDVSFNLLAENKSKLYNLDNGKYIFGYGNLNSFNTRKNSISLNVRSSDNIINDFLKTNTDKNIELDFYNDSSIGLNEIYVAIDSSKRFYLSDESGNYLDVCLASTLDIQLLDDLAQFILILSSIENIPYKFLPDIPINYNYFPRVLIDNKFILYREQIIISFNYLLHSTYLDFYSDLLKRIENANSEEFNYVINDMEILVELESEQCLKKLYSELKYRDKIVLKESLYNKSDVKINGEIFNNEILVSYYKNNNSTFYTLPNEISNLNSVDMLKEWIYFKISISSSIDDLFDVLLMISKIGIKFFYIFFIENNQRQLRLRCKGIDNLNSIVKIFAKEGLSNYNICPYLKEEARYRKIGIIQFENFSCDDSIRILDTIRKQGLNISSMTDEEKLALLVSNTKYLLEYFQFSDDNVFDILKGYILGKDNRTTKRLIYEFIDKPKFQMSEFNTRYNFKNNIIDLIHLSNIRLIGNDINLENECYKYIALFYKERKYYVRSSDEIF